MAIHLPRNEDEFLAINGVGHTKLAKYGSDFLRLIREHCEHGGATLTDAAEPNPSLARPLTRRRFQEVGDLYASGQAIDQIAGIYNVTRQTIVQNLEKYLGSGGHIDPVRLLTESRLLEKDRSAALEAFEHHGLERLRPIYESLGGVVSYEELHLLRLYLLAKG
jgi:ATP-dependent DNA helicase RecQ